MTTEKEKASVDHVASPAGSEKFQFDPEADALERNRVLRKMDWHLLPFISLLYLLSFL